MDRNEEREVRYFDGARSLSARRAWIEMAGPVSGTARSGVALRKESVDRNNAPSGSSHEDIESLSARRAWIEIGHEAAH